MAAVVTEPAKAAAVSSPGVDREVGLLGRPMPTDRLRGWVVTIVLTVIAPQA